MDGHSPGDVLTAAGAWYIPARGTRRVEDDALSVALQGGAVVDEVDARVLRPGFFHLEPLHVLGGEGLEAFVGLESKLGEAERLGHLSGHAAADVQQTLKELHHDRRVRDARVQIVAGGMPHRLRRLLGEFHAVQHVAGSHAMGLGKVDDVDVGAP